MGSSFTIRNTPTPTPALESCSSSSTIVWSWYPASTAIAKQPFSLYSACFVYRACAVRSVLFFCIHDVLFTNVYGMQMEMSNPGPLGLPLKTRQRALYHSKLVIYIYVYQLESTQPTSSSLSSSPPRSSAISPSRPFSTNKAFRADARFACLCAASAKRSSRLGVG